MSNKFLRLVLHPFKYRMFMMAKIPAAYVSGVRVRYADETKAVVTVPYKWFTTNPFRSTYFACLAMAAEMSTGLLCMAHLYEQSPAVSMLIVKNEAVYLKKATGLTIFTCEDGMLIKAAIQEAMASGKSTSFSARSIGKNKEDEVVAEFTFTWSFKARTT